MATLKNPLRMAPTPEVPLSKAPLARVVAQVRFPLVVAIEQRDFVAPFQEAIRNDYPILRQQQIQGFLPGTTGLTPQPPQAAWRFSDAARAWLLTLTPEFLALETVAYAGRSDFISRFRDAVSVLGTHVSPKLIDRLGIRYIDRVVGEPMKDIAALLNSEARGILGTPIAADATFSISESMFSLDSDRIIARWGTLAPGSTVDPAALEPVDEPSWVLDLDMYSTETMSFSVEQIAQDTTRFAERIYTIFRWAVTEDFLRLFGGEI